MLNRVLTKADCAECKLCCGFYEDEIWEAPITRNLSYNEKGLYLCPELGEDGCMLGEEKPFVCKLWPFRVMRLGGFTVLALSPLCKKVNDKPLSELLAFVEEELAELAQNGMKSEPEHIKEYKDGYTILKIL